jgi:peptidoglycan/LPS O-acetylase OafA/YrhL
VAWVAGQLTVVQFFNPEALRGFGVGVLNGSLWTIAVEVQFYLFVPLLYRLCIDHRSRRTALAWLAGLAAASYCLWFASQLRGGAPQLLDKLVQVTLAPYLFMFLIGVAVQRNISRLSAVVEGRATYWLAFYVASQFAVRPLLGNPFVGFASANVATALVAAASFALLAMCVVSAAFTARALSERALSGHDISYGVYIYHMLVVNLFVVSGWQHHGVHLAGVMLVTIAAAAASWLLVERPSLRLKRMSIRPAWRPTVAEA